jgi:hypothetical protein
MATRAQKMKKAGRRMAKTTGRAAAVAAAAQATVREVTGRRRQA